MKTLLICAGLIIGGLAIEPTQALADFDCQDGEITIGIARAKTGGFAFFDVAGARGMAVGIDEINADGGIDGCMVKIIDGDTQSNPALAGQVAEELIAQGADIIIAPSDFDVGVGAAIAAQAAGLFSMSPESSSIAWTQAVQPNFFVSGMTEEDLGRTIAGFANSRGWDGAYIVTNTAFSFFTKQEDAFRGVFDGTVVGRDAVTDDTTDYSAVISKIRSAGDDVDVIFLNDYFPHVGTFLKQARAAGITAAVVGNGTFSSTTLPDVVGAAGLQDVFYIASAYYEGEGMNSDLEEMVASYQEKFGNFPENTNAIVAYYAAHVIADGLKKAGSTDADALTNAIMTQTNFQVPGATFFEWRERYPAVSAAVVGFDSDGNFRLVDMLDPRDF